MILSEVTTASGSSMLTTGIEAFPSLVSKSRKAVLFGDDDNVAVELHLRRRAEE